MKQQMPRWSAQFDTNNLSNCDNFMTISFCSTCFLPWRLINLWSSKNCLTSMTDLIGDDYIILEVSAKLMVLRRFALWRHQMETFSALLALCAGNSPVTGELLSQRPVTRSFDGFFDLCLNKRLTIELTIVRLVIWDAIAPIMTSS